MRTAARIFILELPAVRFPYRLYHREFPSALDNAFREATRGLEPDEVELFQHLQYAFETLTGDFAVDVLHGHRSQVKFRALSRWAPSASAAQRELCDLMIISFRADPFQARLTCVQNKADKRIGSVPRAFKADMLQWELLSARPAIRGLNGFTPPAILLSGALLSSIGSFGVFYRDAGLDYSMAYKIASELAPASTGKAIQRSLLDLRTPPQVRTVAGHQEIVSTPSTYQFAAQLSLLRIGTPIHGLERVGTRETQGYRAETRRWLSSTIQRRIASVDPEYFVARDGSAVWNFAVARRLLGLLGSADGGDQPRGEDDGPTLVLIQTDGRIAERR